MHHQVYDSAISTHPRIQHTQAEYVYFKQGNGVMYQSIITSLYINPQLHRCPLVANPSLSKGQLRTVKTGPE